jgi:pimeloyl-ACP methyl ester carboxylesterase
VARAPRTLPKALLLPGIDGSGRLFGPLLAAAPRAFEPEIVSYPPQRPRGYGELAALVREKLPRGRFLILAESFSGPIAVRLAAERPPGLAALVLAATFLHRPLAPPLHAIRGLVGAGLLGLPLPAALIRHFLAGPDAPSALVAEVKAAVAAVPREVMACRAEEALRADVREDFARVDAPILWLAPSRDRLVRTDAYEEILDLRPDAEVAPVDAPHMVLQRCPHAALARIEELLSRPDARAGTVA